MARYYMARIFGVVCKALDLHQSRERHLAKFGLTCQPCPRRGDVPVRPTPGNSQFYLILLKSFHCKSLTCVRFPIYPLHVLDIGITGLITLFTKEFMFDIT